MNVYNNVAEIAKKKGMPLRKLESEAGISTGAISKWRTSSPTIDKLQAVANVLGVKVDKLLK